MATGDDVEAQAAAPQDDLRTAYVNAAKAIEERRQGVARIEEILRERMVAGSVKTQADFEASQEIGRIARMLREDLDVGLYVLRQELGVQP